MLLFFFVMRRLLREGRCLFCVPYWPVVRTNFKTFSSLTAKLKSCHSVINKLHWLKNRTQIQIHLSLLLPLMVTLICFCEIQSVFVNPKRELPLFCEGPSSPKCLFDNLALSAAKILAGWVKNTVAPWEKWYTFAVFEDLEISPYRTWQSQSHTHGFSKCQRQPAWFLALTIS